MIYSKVSIPVKPEKKEEAEKASYEEEIFAAEEAYCKEELLMAQKREDALASFFTFLLVVFACFFSFAFGNSFNKNGFHDTLSYMNAVSAGRIPFDFKRDKAGFLSESDVKTQKTVYEKYKNADENITFSTDDGYYGINDEPETKKDSFVFLKQDEKTDVQASNGISTASSLDGEILLPVISRNISSYGELLLSNETKFSPDIAALSEEIPDAFCGIDETLPTVLILHTHATESYNESEYDGYYSESVPTRSEDTSKNVVYVGEVLKNYLEDFGICTLHDETLCDKESFVYAYNKSNEVAKKYLDEYPSIKLVIDLHRDSIISPDGTKTKPVFDYAGKKTAQLMFVVGTNEAGAKHENWEENLKTALYIQEKASESCPELFRKINLRKASFNQQLCTGYLLLECGSCANTRAEAENAVKIFACALARMIKEV